MLRQARICRFEIGGHGVINKRLHSKLALGIYWDDPLRNVKSGNFFKMGLNRKHAQTRITPSQVAMEGQSARPKYRKHLMAIA